MPFKLLKHLQKISFHIFRSFVLKLFFTFLCHYNNSWLILRVTLIQENFALQFIKKVCRDSDNQNEIGNNI